MSPLSSHSNVKVPIKILTGIVLFVSLGFMNPFRASGFAIDTVNILFHITMHPLINAVQRLGLSFKFFRNYTTLEMLGIKLYIWKNKINSVKKDTSSGD